MKEFYRDDDGVLIIEGDCLIYNSWIPSSGPYEGQGVVREDELGVFWVEGTGRKERLRSLANCLIVDNLPVDDATKLLEPGALLYWHSGRARHRI